MRRKILLYNPKLKMLAKALRANMTLAEVLLWNELKHGKMHGMDFDRQRPILNYIVDFYCKDLMLAIEVDGSSHKEKFDEDLKRQMELEQKGVRVLRFSDHEVKENMPNVLRVIEAHVVNYISSEGNGREGPSPDPSQEGKY